VNRIDRCLRGKRRLYCCWHQALLCSPSSPQTSWVARRCGRLEKPDLTKRAPARGTGAMIQSMFIISVEVLPLRLPPGTTAYAHPISRQDVVRRAARYMGNQVHGHLTGRTMQLPVSLSPQPTSMWMQTLPKAKHPVKVACGVKATTKSHSVSRRVSTATPGRCALTRFGRGGCAAQSKDVLIEKHWGSITDRSVRNPALPLDHSQPTRQMPSAPE
jgi:hypothetical protein